MKVQASNIDIMHLPAAPDYDILYCDPPWDNKMVKFFQTVQKRDTGVVTENTIGDIINKLGELADPRKPLYVEYSIYTYQAVIDILTKHGHRLTGKYELMMSYNKPYMILIFNTNVMPDPNLKGFNITTDIVKKHGNPVVFDPFAGLGLTAKAVVKGGGTYIGSELNAKRFAKFKAYADKVNAQ